MNVIQIAKRFFQQGFEDALDALATHQPYFERLLAQLIRYLNLRASQSHRVRP